MTTPSAPALARLPVPAVARAKGCWIFDEDGRDYLDGSSGTICVNVGHSVPEVLAAMAAQAREVCFAHYSQFTSRPATELTRSLLELTGPAFREVVYTNSGSEATEAALRLIFHHHAQNAAAGRTVVLTQQPSYHGMTAGALSISGHPVRRLNLTALHDNQISVEGVRSGGGELLPGPDEWAEAFARVGADRVAAVVVEVVGGAASGAGVVEDRTLVALRQLCSQSGALLACDEVMTGFGRTGTWFASFRAGMHPDLLITGKGISGGYTPIGACLVGRDVLPGRSATEAAIGHTMNGNPLSAATALAVLRYLRDNQLDQRARATGDLLRKRLAEVTAAFGFTGAPRGRGMLLGIPVRQAAEDFARQPLNRQITAAALSRGLLLYPAGIDARSQAVLVAPPLTLLEVEADVLMERLVAALGDVEADLR